MDLFKGLEEASRKEALGFLMPAWQAATEGKERGTGGL